jgi:hypothetical protein
MSETIKIIQPSNSNFQITVGVRTTDLIDRLKIEEDEKKTLLDESAKILSNCINPIDTIGSTTGIAIGYVQSGKTMSFTTLTALAIDNGFRVVIYFAGNKNNLLEQTTKRLKKDLLTESDNSQIYKTHQSPTVDDILTIKNSLGLDDKPAILITVLKHYKHIDDLAKIFETLEVRDALGNNGVLIIDDEADQASLNTYARKNSKTEDWEDDEFSTTYSSILKLRGSLSNHSYIQYTATPQANLLTNIIDLLSPKFHVVLTPGKTYTGGKVFFRDNPDLIITIPDAEVYHSKKNDFKVYPQSLVDALQLFFIGVAVTVNILKKEKFLSMMVHADQRRDASKKFIGWIEDFIENWGNRLKLPDGDPTKLELENDFKYSYEDAVRRMDDPPSFELVIKAVKQVILDTKPHLIISNEERAKEIDWSNHRSHILVGADMLNRGYTVEGLAVSYMPRYSIGKSNADTIQQRCRFFGYKSNYLDSCRVFLPNDSILEYHDYVIHEEIMHTNLKKSTLGELEQVLILDNSMNATRNNVLSINVVKHKLKGWRQMNALQHVDENLTFVNNFLNKHTFTNYNPFGTPDRNHRFLKLGIQEVINFLKDFKIANVPDTLRKSSTIQYLRHLATKNQIEFAYIFEMSYAYDISKSKGTSLIDLDNKLKIGNIFSGRSTVGADIYPGDQGIRFEDSLCIQIHKVKLKHHSNKWGGKIIYTLGLYYPEKLIHSFTGIEK